MYYKEDETPSVVGLANNIKFISITYVVLKTSICTTIIYKQYTIATNISTEQHCPTSTVMLASLQNK